MVVALHAEIRLPCLQKMGLFRGVGIVTACATAQYRSVNVLLHESGLFMAAVAKTFLF